MIKFFGAVCLYSVGVPLASIGFALNLPHFLVVGSVSVAIAIGALKMLCRGTKP